jgi:MFS family permease
VFRIGYHDGDGGEEFCRVDDYSMVPWHGGKCLLSAGDLLPDYVHARSKGRPVAESRFYRRGELARRLALFYAAQSIASAFGGLLAFGVFQIQSGSLDDWRYLFLIEGVCTFTFGIFAFFYLPYNAERCRFFNAEEKKLAHYRIQVDSSSVVNEKFNFKDSVRIFKHPTSWAILGTPSLPFTL